MSAAWHKLCHARLARAQVIRPPVGDKNSKVRVARFGVSNNKSPRRTQVGFQTRGRAVAEGDEAIFGPLALANQHQAFGQIEVGGKKRSGLTNPHAGCVQELKEGGL